MYRKPVYEALLAIFAAKGLLVILFMDTQGVFSRYYLASGCVLALLTYSTYHSPDQRKSVIFFRYLMGAEVVAMVVCALYQFGQGR